MRAGLAAAPSGPRGRSARRRRACRRRCELVERSGAARRVDLLDEHHVVTEPREPEQVLEHRPGRAAVVRDGGDHAAHDDAQRLAAPVISRSGSARARGRGSGSAAVLVVKAGEVEPGTPAGRLEVARRGCGSSTDGVPDRVRVAALDTGRPGRPRGSAGVASSRSGRRRASSRSPTRRRAPAGCGAPAGADEHPLVEVLVVREALGHSGDLGDDTGVHSVAGIARDV